VLLVQCLVPGCFPDSRIVSLPRNSLFCSVLRASSAPSSSPPPLTVSHRCSRVVQEAVESSRMLQLTPCSTSRWPLGTKSLAGTVLLPPTRALSPWLAIAARQGVGSVCSRAVHGLAAFDTDTCSGWERRRCEWLCAASSTRQERPCFARSTTHARSLRSPAAAARRPTRGSARARSGPCATATPAVSTHASCHRHHRCQSAAPLPLLRLVLIPARTRLVQSEEWRCRSRARARTRFAMGPTRASGAAASGTGKA